MSLPENTKPAIWQAARVNKIAGPITGMEYRMMYPQSIVLDVDSADVEAWTEAGKMRAVDESKLVNKVAYTGTRL